ncbi:Crp/Fnr family transcriptional regulator [Acinetobacter sp. B10A]|uniref:Crp/Fnr family transcriptional regulator n=1 Tax=Acinetobacter baretiae TaxID=2605383 RepID=UPI001B3C6EE7|nr:Crp/Fnr family transcriptional regulator [Acinetobacter baretiae]MBF7685431.1 Crp/Fnr family transcriptional regulator [Acinetobacter baretiae]
MQYCTASEIDFLFKNIKIKHFHQDQTIYERHSRCDEMIVILNGTLKLGWNAYDGRYIIHRFIPSGALLNISYLITHAPFEHQYIAHEATSLAIIPGHIFQTLIQSNSQVMYHMLQLVCQRTRLLDNDIYHQNAQSLRQQIARQLLYLVEYFTLEQHGEIKLLIKLSQENFAELLKISRQSLRKELRWFIEQSIITTQYNQMIITDITQLRALISEAN